MRRNDEALLQAAVMDLRSAEWDRTQLSVSAQRVADRIGLGTVAVDWSAPKRDFAGASASAGEPRLPSWTLAWATLPACALLVCSFLFYKAFWQVPPGVRAEVLSVDGSAYRISGAGEPQLLPGAALHEGDVLRTSGGAHAVLRLADGSSVEVNERSVLGVGARGHDVTLSLESGAVIVQATKRSSGHLYVKTPDCRVAVTGTVFSVNSGIKGSRVAVLQGAVHVIHAGLDTLVSAGDQMASNDSLSPSPVEQQIAWSHDRDRYLSLLAQFATLQHRFEQVQLPQPRYTSDLLPRVPTNTLLYVSIPNLGESLSQANAIFQDQLKQSPGLQQWWAQGSAHKNQELNTLVSEVRDMSQYLGDEVVVVGLAGTGNPDFAVVADLQKTGLDDYLKKQFSSSATPSGITVLEPGELALFRPSGAQSAPLALVRRNEVVFSSNVATLRLISAQLDAGASGFVAGDFGQQIKAAYGRGAGVIVAADLHRMIGAGLDASPANGNRGGMESVRYLIAEHREINGVPENHLNLQFSGSRQRVASWLAAPAPIGSLDFITPNAAIAVAFLSKEPSAIAEDMMQMASSGSGAQEQDLSNAEKELHLSFRDDLAANLGGDFLVSLDGPVLPTVSWKSVVEVHNADRLEQTLERLAQSTQTVETNQARTPHIIKIESTEVGEQRFYSVLDASSGITVVQYTFSGGYMILAPTRALLMESLRTHASGDSLAHSEAFKKLLPKDQNENYSAVAYQNLSPVLTPLLSQFSGQSAIAMQELAADARPTAVCAWGRDTRIEAASNSHLLGFDFLALATLINHGNIPIDKIVRE